MSLEYGDLVAGVALLMFLITWGVIVWSGYKQSKERSGKRSDSQ